MVVVIGRQILNLSCLRHKEFFDLLSTRSSPEASDEELQPRRSPLTLALSPEGGEGNLVRRFLTQDTDGMEKDTVRGSTGLS